MAFVAKKIFLTKGVGKHRERLSSFELALRNAGIAACNIVRVSSIFPPNCKLISRSEGLKHLKPGQVAFTVISENSTKEPHRLIAASIGLALPSDKSMYGYLSEHHSFGETEEVAGEYAEELAAEMLATTLNVEFDPDLSFDEKKEVYRISNKIVRTMTAFRIFQRLAAAFSILLLPAALQAADRVTILYDAFSDSKEMVKDWGFSALVEHDGKRILFDTGNNADIFQRNVKSLGIDLTKLDFVVISHRRFDVSLENVGIVPGEKEN